MVSIGLVIVVLAVVVGLVFMVVLGVLIPILMNRRNTNDEDKTPVVEEDGIVENTVKIPSSEEKVDKKEILEQLANKEITQEEAERRLAE